MIQGSAFQTRARTVDHLGREQIADCPTAISELWKNSFDAYARSVELNIYGGKEPVAVIADDGHGMSSEEFSRRWLVVGTETKVIEDRTPIKDRNGLKLRPRQGQKGIGRLSCANLGPLLLLISKRRGMPFVAALVDWRLFENPFINLSDIFIPVAEFDRLGMVFEQLPELAGSLSENIVGGEDAARKQRILDAWKASDDVFAEEHHDRENDAKGSLSQRIIPNPLIKDPEGGFRPVGWLLVDRRWFHAWARGRIGMPHVQLAPSTVHFISRFHGQGERIPAAWRRSSFHGD